MKRAFLQFLCAVLLLVTAMTSVAIADENKPSIVVTIFPIYDWTLQLLGEEADKAELTWLMDNGVDAHSYQPSVQDMVALAQADLVICIGGPSEAWILEAVEKSGNSGRVLALMDVLKDRVVDEVFVEGMQGEPEETTEEDEHIWLSLINAQLACREIAAKLQTLTSIDPVQIEDNSKTYRDALSGLDVSYREAVDRSARLPLLFADRFPFRYLTEDYGLAYYAAFQGCSAETEASFQTVAFLADQVMKYDLPCVVVLDGSDEKIAKSVADASGGVSIQVMNSMQTVTSSQAEAGMTYIGIMQSNLDILKIALGAKG